jgi:hypothetical protein
MNPPAVPHPPDIDKGMHGDDVIAVKHALSRAGYLPWGNFTPSLLARQRLVALRAGAPSALRARPRPASWVGRCGGRVVETGWPRGVAEIAHS